MSPPESPLDAIARGRGATDAAGALRLADGTTLALGDGPSRFTVVERVPGTLAGLAAAPSMLAVGEAFIDGAFDVEGDLIAAMATAYRVAEPLPEDARAGEPRAGSAPGPAAARAAAHYELASEFYALFLDRRMVYTCAYWPRPEATLEEAQEAKLDLVCRKLALAHGERLLDVGCGWGGLVTWAAERCGAAVHGVTVSSAQAAWAAREIARRGLAGRAHVEPRDVHALAADGSFDKIAAVGVIEHVGVANFPAYFRRVRDLVRPDGLVLSHGITHATTSPRTSGMAFLDRYVFPGGDLATLAYTVDAMRGAGLAIVHVEALGSHYVPTLRAWLGRLLARRAEAVALVGERTVRIYLGYLAAAAVAFEAGWIDVHQVLARRT